MGQRDDRKKLGQRGEDLAALYLSHNGCEILERNFRANRGEIDIIARDGDEMIFVEVKTDRTGRFGTPESWVTPRKQRQLIKIAELYLQQLEDALPPCRFDVITISYPDPKQNPQIRHIKNAFFF